MTELAQAIAELVDANHILAHEGVVDAFGHISRRHPEDPSLSCCRNRAAPSW
jgi:hypothetical protein